jgi:hypothetical protein
VEKEGWEDSEEQPGECGGLARVHGGGRGEDQVGVFVKKGIRSRCHSPTPRQGFAHSAG